ncbi:PP2C family protein-serine/threonine phosphatase [Actinokineospora enzanensis]|uniref:PP2C family protein-serine/threonine phosphatase n=1 Tax=Actinokineospora enzanensis TaxID=155975 RepID=UPI000375546E|nr:protein phosphatase 2C domain-containing protein [Actinokineospora enzanensis]
MIFTSATANALGARDTNQDAWHATRHHLAVADGVGGAPAGDVASALSVQAVSTTGGDSPELLVAAANDLVRRHAETDPATAGMGSTLDVAILTKGRGRWVVRGAHVGDSVTIVQTAESMELLTRPHTLGLELVAAGHLTEEEGARHPNRSALVRAIGLEPVVRPDLWERTAVRGNRYVLCTDGLTNAVGQELWNLLAALRSAKPAMCADTLVQAACAAGARDNVTVVVGDVSTAWLN